MLINNPTYCRAIEFALNWSVQHNLTDSSRDSWIEKIAVCHAYLYLYIKDIVKDNYLRLSPWDRIQASYSKIKSTVPVEHYNWEDLRQNVWLSHEQKVMDDVIVAYTVCTKPSVAWSGVSTNMDNEWRRIYQGEYDAIFAGPDQTQELCRFRSRAGTIEIYAIKGRKTLSFLDPVVVYRESFTLAYLDGLINVRVIEALEPELAWEET